MLHKNLKICILLWICILLNKVKCEGQSVPCFCWGIVSQINDWIQCEERQTKVVQEASGQICSHLTIPWPTRSCLVGWVWREIEARRKDSTKGYTAAPVSRLKQLCLSLSVSCRILFKINKSWILSLILLLSLLRKMCSLESQGNRTWEQAEHTKRNPS